MMRKSVLHGFTHVSGTRIAESMPGVLSPIDDNLQADQIPCPTLLASRLGVQVCRGLGAIVFRLT